MSVASEKHLQVKALFLESVEALARSRDELVTAVSTGLDGVFDQLLRQACAEVGADIDAFAAELEADDAMRGEIQKKLAELFNPASLGSARAAALKRDLERHLQVLRYVLSGVEPAAWVWDTMDEEEAGRVRAFRASGGDDDPELLKRVEHALEKFKPGAAPAYGACESCGKEIPMDRLQLMPWSARCQPCQLEADRAAAGTHAPDGWRAPMWMFFEGGKPVPKDKQFQPGS